MALEREDDDYSSGLKQSLANAEKHLLSPNNTIINILVDTVGFEPTASSM